MSPVDAIGPPKRNNKKVTTDKPSTPHKVSEQKTRLPDDIGSKKRLIWIIAGSITVIIFIGWALLLSGGKLTDQEGTSFFSQLENRVVNLWTTIKTDILKLPVPIEETSDKINDEKINKLEEEVFPQFSDPDEQ